MGKHDRDIRPKTGAFATDSSSQASHLSAVQRKLGNARLVQMRQQQQKGQPEPPPSWLAGELTDGAAPVQARGELDSPDVHALAAQGTAGASQSLPHLGRIQEAFGHHDVSGVKSAIGGAAAEASQAMGATAYASGNNVAFSSAPDLHLAAHEAAHVVQQRGGVRLSGGVGQAGDAYERHADAVAEKVVRGESAEPLLDQMAHRGSSGGSAVQRQLHGGEPDSAQETGPAAHIPRRPDPGPLVQRMRSLMENTARSQNVPMPEEALNHLTTSIAEQLARGGVGVLARSLEDVESQGSGIDYRWSLGGQISHGDPQDMTTGRARGTVRSQQDRGGTVETQETSRDRESEQGTMSGSASRSPGSGGGDSYGGSYQNQQSDEHEHTRRGTGTGRESGQVTRELQLEQEHTDYLTDVVLALDFRLDLGPDSWMGPVAGMADLLGGPAARPDAAVSRSGAVGPEIIGSIQNSHQRVAPPRERRPGRQPRRRRLPQRIE